MRLLKYVGYGFAVLLLLATLGVLVPRYGNSSQSFASSSGEGAQDIKLSGLKIRVLSNPIHTDIAISLNDKTKELFGNMIGSTLPLDHPNAKWLIFGWGSEAFYTQTPSWSDLKASAVLKALTIDSAVMHVELAPEFDLTKSMREYAISADQSQSLLEYVGSSFTRIENRAQLFPDAGYGEFDQFYRAHGWFNALIGCNTWTAAALREAGLATGWWNPVPQSLMISLDLYNR